MLPPATHTPIVPCVCVTCITYINMSVCPVICVKSDNAVGVRFFNKMFFCYNNLISQIADLFQTEQGVIYFIHGSL